MTKVGKFYKPHGFNGEINLALEVGFDIEECHFIFAEIDGLMVPFEIETVRERGNDGLLVSFQRMNAKMLQQLINKEAFVDDEYVLEEDLDETSPAFYVGFELVDEKGATLGTVDDYDDSTPNVLFDVSGHLVPAGALEVIDLDAEKKKIVCRLPEGILDL